MLSTIEGIYRKGKIEFSQLPVKFQDETKVLVVFPDNKLTDKKQTGKNPINLPERGIDKSQALMLRDRLSTFMDDWESPEMDIYDDYDRNKTLI